MKIYELVATSYSEPDHYSVKFYATKKAADRHRELAEEWNSVFEEFDIYYKLDAELVNPYDDNSYGDTDYAVIEHEVSEKAPRKSTKKWFDPRIKLTKAEQDVVKRLKFLGIAENINKEPEGRFLPVIFNVKILTKLVALGLVYYENDSAQLTPNGVLVYYWYRSKGKMSTW